MDNTSSRITILLTACVNPAGMSQTLLQDSNLRLAHYIKALYFYLENTNFKVLIVENTGLDLSAYIENKWIESKRLEILYFQGNKYDKRRGKGYGEALIIEYAFKYSTSMVSSDYIIKITGRYMILNIVNTLKSYETNILRSIPFVAVEDCYYNYKICSSECIIAPVSFYKDYFLPQLDRIDDSRHFYFEHLLYESIGKWKINNKFCIFNSALNISAISGSTSLQINRNVKHKIKHWGRRLIYMLFFK